MTNHKGNDNHKIPSTLKEVEELVNKAGIKVPEMNTITEARQVYYQLLVAQMELTLKHDALRRSMEEREISQKRYRDLFDFGPLGYLFLNEKGIIVEANQTAGSMLGISKNSLIKEQFERFIVHEDIAIFRNHLKSRFESSAPQIYMISLIRNHGTPLRARLEIAAIPEADKAPGYRISISGIPDQKWAEERVHKHKEQVAQNLKKSEERFSQITELSREVVWEVDPVGLYTYVSPVSIAVYGYSPENMVGKMHFYDLHPEETRESIKREALKLFEKKENFHDFVNNILTPEGKIVWISTNGIPILDEFGNYSGYRGSDADITERVLMERELVTSKEKAEASDRLKTAFMQNISHEVRTPLNGIIGFSNLMAENNVTQEEKQEYALLLKTSSDRLLRTITDYMDISLLASGSHAPHIKELDIKPILEIILKKYERVCQIHHHSIQLSIPDAPHDIKLKTDRDFLDKIFSALLDNAVKFTKNGSITMGYFVDLKQIEFFVKDTGVGISPDAMEHIFNPFMQEDLNSSRKFEGSGLGLTIADGLIKLLGGTIRLESEKGVGTTVRFTFPYEPGAYAQIVPVMFDHKHDASKLPVVLIAEDEYISSHFMQVIVKGHASKTYFAYNGKEAVDLCREHPEISLILMDIKMPVMDGYAAARNIRSFRPELPIIALTAFAMSNDKQKALDEGFNDFLTKPVTQEEVINIVKKYG